MHCKINSRPSAPSWLLESSAHRLPTLQIVPASPAPCQGRVCQHSCHKSATAVLFFTLEWWGGRIRKMGELRCSIKQFYCASCVVAKKALFTHLNAWLQTQLAIDINNIALQQPIMIKPVEPFKPIKNLESKCIIALLIWKHNMRTSTRRHYLFLINILPYDSCKKFVLHDFFCVIGTAT